MALSLSGCLAAPPDSTATPPVDAAGEPDAAGVEPVVCAQPTLVTDDFNDTMALPNFAAGESGTASVTMDGELALLDLATSGSATLASYHAFSLDEASAYIEVVETPDPGTLAAFYFAAVHDGQNQVGFKIQAGKLEAEYRTGGGETTQVESVTFDPEMHRWLRLREEGETMYWEASQDGGTYEEIARAPSVVPLTYVRIVLHGDSDPDELLGGVVQLDNFNGGGPPSGAWCPAASFGADFEDPDAFDAWTEITDPGCSITVKGGLLQFDLDSGMVGSCHFVAGPRFDLTGSSAGIEIVEAIDASEDALSSFRLYADLENWIEMRVTGGILKLVLMRAGTPSAPFATEFMPSEHATWRMREQGAAVQFQTHNGTSWKTLYELDAPFDLTALEMRLTVIVQSTSLTQGRVVTFDNYNLNLPP